MEEARTHPITLRFASDALEAAFQEDYVRRSVRPVRIAILLGCALYAGYGILDAWFVPGATHLFRLIRLAVCSASLGIFGLTFTPFFRRWMQPVLAGGSLLAGLGITAMVGLVDASRGFFYHDHLMLVVVFTSVLLRLRFVYAAAACGVLVAAYEAVALGAQTMPLPIFLNGTLALGSTGLLCMVAGYFLEANARKVFWRTRVIDAQRLRNEHLVQTQSRFFANLSHEFRTPLTLIIGPVENLLAGQQGALPAGLHRQLAITHRNARRLLRLINQILDLSQLEAGCMTLHARRGDVVRLTRGIVHSFASYAERRQIALQFHAEPEALIATFDADQVEKILYNLLSNAFKFTSEKGKIRVTVAEEGAGDEGRVVLRVQDTGTGIAPEEIPHLFDRFHRAGRGVRPAGEGTGIGLALVKELVALHGGAVEVRSEPGFGSAFTVRLPKVPPLPSGAPTAAAPAEEAAAAVRPAGADVTAIEDPGASGAGARPAVPVDTAATGDGAADPVGRSDRTLLLLVDDNEDFRQYLRAALEPAYRIAEARNGEEALAAAREVIPDLIIADVMMPRMDGYAFCRHVREDDLLNHIPVILLSARASGESKLAGLETGADDYLYKPFNAKELRARVKNLIALRRALRRRYARELLAPPPEPSAPSADEAFLARAREAVEQHLSDAAFNVDALADVLGMSTRQLQRKLRALTGHSPNAFIRLVRLKRSARLLEQGAGTVSEIAYEVGFNHPTYFMKRFREVFGQSPSEFGAGGRGPAVPPAADGSTGVQDPTG